MVPVLVATLFLVITGHISTAGQTKATQPPLMKLPCEEVTRIPSPDSKWILVFECPNECKERKLWIEGNTSPSRKLR